MDTTSILSTFAARSFALMNPLGMLPIFMGYSANLDVGVQRWLALLVSLTVMGLTLLFLVTGHAIIDFFGITLNSFRIAGGILLLLIGINIVTGDAGKAAKDLVIEAQSSQLGADWQLRAQVQLMFLKMGAQPWERRPAASGPADW